MLRFWRDFMNKKKLKVLHKIKFTIILASIFRYRFKKTNIVTMVFKITVLHTQQMLIYLKEKEYHLYFLNIKLFLKVTPGRDQSPLEKKK